MKPGIYGFDGEHDFLSNFYPSLIKIEFNDEILDFPDVEHAFQFMKTIDKEWQDRIYHAPTPGKAKLFGRQCKLRDNWDQSKDRIMEYFVKEKFKQNPDLRERLLATGDLYLEETNTWRDDYWGVYNGKGQNKLGHILMKIRESFK